MPDPTPIDPVPVDDKAKLPKPAVTVFSSVDADTAQYVTTKELRDGTVIVATKTVVKADELAKQQKIIVDAQATADKIIANAQLIIAELQ